MNQQVSFSPHQPLQRVLVLTQSCSNITKGCVVKLLLSLLMGKPRKPKSWISYVSGFLKEASSDTRSIQCPTGGGNCFYGDMDLSPGLFGYFASLDAGKISIEWNFGGNAPQPQPQPQPEPTTTQAPPPPPPPPTTTSSTYSPPPPPTSTSSPQPSSTTSSSSSSVPPSSSSSLAASTGSTTQSGAPQQTGSSNDVNTESAAGESNLSNLAQAFVNMGEMVRVAGQLGA